LANKLACLTLALRYCQPCERRLYRLMYTLQSSDTKDSTEFCR